MGDWSRELTSDERRLILAARQKAFLLYEGRLTRHRSCGIAMAETFGLGTRPYQALRRGGITGHGECGVVVSGRMVLGEVFGDPDPAGATTPVLAASMREYVERVTERMDRGAAAGDSVVCNVLTAPFPDFRGAARASFCAALATEVATLVAEVILRNGGEVDVSPIPGVESFDPAQPVEPLPTSA